MHIVHTRAHAARSAHARINSLAHRLVTIKRIKHLCPDIVNYIRDQLLSIAHSPSTPHTVAGTAELIALNIKP